MWQKIKDAINRIKDKVINIGIIFILLVTSTAGIIKCVHDGIPTAIDAIDIVALVAMALVFAELRQNKKINEAQLIKDINSEFINNQQLSRIERMLEVYYDEY